MEETKPSVTEREQKRIDRENKVQERAAEEKRLKAEYFKIAKSVAFQDLVYKIRSFSDYHTKVAKDGVGFDKDQRVIRLGAEERLSEMDKASGIEEIIDYLDRKVTIEPTIKKETK